MKRSLKALCVTWLISILFVVPVFAGYDSDWDKIAQKELSGKQSILLPATVKYSEEILILGRLSVR